MTPIVEAINYCKTRSVKYTTDQQIAYIPRLETDQVEYITYRYNYNGMSHLVTQGQQLCIKLKYLRFINPNYEKNYSGIFPASMMFNNAIYPFVIFINGRFIPHTRMIIVIDNGNYYIIISNNGDNEYYNELFLDPQYVQILSLPNNFKIVKENIKDAVFSFNDNGEYDKENVVYSVIQLNDRVDYKFWNIDGDVVNASNLFSNKSVKISKSNVFLFINKLFSIGDKQKVKIAVENYKEDDNGIKRQYLDFRVTNKTLNPNPNIAIDGSLITIGYATNPYNDVYDLGLIVNSDISSDSIDNYRYMDHDEVSDAMVHYNDTAEKAEYLDHVFIPFDFQMSLKKKYSDNVMSALNYIINYRSSILNPIFEESSNLYIEEHNGEWLNSIMSPNGTISIPASHGSMVDEFIIMLVNGVIYENFYMSKYRANSIIIPIQDIINDDDKIELLRFKNINNSILDISVNESDGYLKYDPCIINTDMRLFATEYNGAAYTYPSDGLQHFEIDYTLETDDNGYIKIVLTDPYYYGKKLKIAYKNRFKYFSFKITSDSTYDEYCIDLDDKFMYCPDYSRYMVFINGRRILSDKYRLVLPVRPTTPFSEFKLYLTTPISKNDRVEVIYTPSLMRDIVINNTIPINGSILIDKKILDYGLSKNLYMLWINGKKIPKSSIYDLYSNHIRIDEDCETIKNFCITQYIPDIDTISRIFDRTSSTWDTINKYLTDDQLGINRDIMTNTEIDIYDGAADIKSIMYELLRDQFISNPRVDVTNEFVYDYTDVDTTAISEKDSGGNYILLAADANHSDNIAAINREYP